MLDARLRQMHSRSLVGIARMSVWQQILSVGLWPRPACSLPIIRLLERADRIHIR